MPPSVPGYPAHIRCDDPGSDSSVARTHRIQQRIDALASRGGGTVFIGPGQWRIVTLFLRSGITLHLERGATLVAETDLRLYPTREVAVDNKDQSPYHLIVARDCQDIALEGLGAIDGQDTAFWTRATRPEERPYGIFDYFVTGQRLSPLVEIEGCRNVRVENLTLTRSPGWTLHFFDCQEVRVRGVRVRNHLMGPNTDGITLNGCRGAFVSECDIITGDDAIGIKASNTGKPAHDIVVHNCIVETNCGAFILGAETIGGIHDVTFSHCIARASLRMIAIELWDAGVVERIHFSHISGKTFPQPGVTCERPIYIDIQQFTRGDGAGLGQVRDVQCTNLLCATRGRIVLTAQDGARLENIVLRDVHLDVPEIEDPQVAVSAARSMQNSNFNPHTRAARAVVVADNVASLTLDNVSVRWPRNGNVPMHGLCVRQVEGMANASPGLRANQPDIADQISA